MNAHPRGVTRGPFRPPPRRPAVWLAAVLALAAVPAVAQRGGPPATDPDWPCIQRLVPTLSGGAYWPGHEAPPDWRSDPRVAALVPEITARGVTAERGAARIAAFAHTVPPAERAPVLSATMAGLVEQTNLQRGQQIERLRALTRRQRGVGDVIARVTAEQRALPPDADPARREEVAQRLAFVIREFEEAEQTLRYACEAPVALEARLGAYARALQKALE